MRRRRLGLSAVAEVQERFEQWRQARTGKARIPDELWAAAIELARRDGVNRTAEIPDRIRKERTSTLRLHTLASAAFVGLRLFFA